MRSRHVLVMCVMMLLTGGLFAARGVNAQQSESTGEEAGTRSPEGVSGLQAVAPQRGGALEAERDPGQGPRPLEPVFLEPAATTTERARLGLSTWIAPGAPFDHREDPGGVAIGFTIAWPAPARPARYVPSSGPSPWRGSAAR
jgi:hypothetical protein